MKTLRILYHMTRADFLERTRRYSFLVMLALVLWIGYLSASGQLRMRVPPDYIGAVNSAWAGGTMTITVTLLLGWFGFYLVKGSVSRDYETGVGQIMATTPLSRPLYTLGKWMSNFTVFGVMILLLCGVGIVWSLWAGTAGLDLWALAAPLLLVALPCMALVAALAVLFETIPWLRGGFGNVVYFLVFPVILIGSAGSMFSSGSGGVYNPWLDIAGWQLIGKGVMRATQVAYLASAGSGFAFSITPLDNPQIFQWNGIQWTAEILLSRLFFLLLAPVIGLFAALFFDRFNPSRLHLAQPKASVPAAPEMDAGSAKVALVSTVHLTPLADARARFSFGALLIGELKLLLKGQRWWWYAIAAGLTIAQAVNDLEVARILLVIAWVWPILILSGFGCREARHNTHQLVFSAPHPLTNQLPARWLAALAVLALLGSGALLRFILAGDTFSVLGWLTGLLFIPSLALVSGVLTGSGKAFEVIYVLWMSLLSQKAPPFDFIGMSRQSPLYLYVPLAIALFIITVLARQAQLTRR